MHVYNAAASTGVSASGANWCRGSNLAQLIEPYGPLSAPEASVIGEVICRALTAVHRAGLLHRDIKAQNVMRESGGRIVLVDFGLGREANLPYPAERAASSWPARRVYLAPELFKRRTRDGAERPVQRRRPAVPSGDGPLSRFEGESLGDIADAPRARQSAPGCRTCGRDLPACSSTWSSARCGPIAAIAIRARASWNRP